MNFRKIPLVKRFYNKTDQLENSIEFLNKECFRLSKDNIELRYKIKKITNEKINVVFICHRPAVWGSLKTVYESMMDDSLFNVTIVTIPNKKQLPGLDLNHEEYVSEGAESFWKGNNVISGYDYEKKIWFDIKKLKPDYVFVQQPYDICRPYQLKSRNISKYAKLAYVSYFTFLPNKINNEVNDSCNPINFLQNLSFYFTQSHADTDYVTQRIQGKNDSLQICLTGFPCFDGFNKLDFSKTVSNWDKNPDSSFKLVWTPRWCTNENNCHFFAYKDLIAEYCFNQPDISLIFRPHPQAFSNWESSGEFPKEKCIKYKEFFSKSNNMKIDTQKEYLSTFYTSTCLITDISSIIPEYFLTGKPIIYCNNPKSTNTFIKGKGYTAGFYWVENWNELKQTLDMLRAGQDPLKEKRLELLKTEFYIPEENSGYLIKEKIKQDFINA